MVTPVNLDVVQHMRIAVILFLSLAPSTSLSCIPASLFEPLEDLVERANSVILVEVISSEFSNSQKKAPCDSRYIESQVSLKVALKGSFSGKPILWPEYSSYLRTGKALVVITPKDGIQYATIWFEGDRVNDFEELLEAIEVLLHNESLSTHTSNADAG